MQAYTKVVAHASFAEAARALGLTRSAVSKAVNELEELLGVRLLERTTRRVTPTEAGLAYYQRCTDVLAAVEETELEVTRLHREPRGVLKINAPMSFGTLHLGEAVAAFMQAYPELRVELVLDDRFVDPLEHGFDVTVRIGILPDSSLIARRIGLARRVLVASPGYLGKHGEPTSPAELAAHRCLVYGHGFPQRWQLERKGETVQVPVRPIMCSNNGEVLLTAARQGLGIAELPTFIAGSDIQADRLKRVLCDYQPLELGIYAVYAHGRQLAAKTRVFVEFLIERFADVPSWDG